MTSSDHIATSVLTLVLCPAVHTASDGRTTSEISCHEGVSSQRMIIVPGVQLSTLFSICCLICCVALPSASEQCTPTIEASVASEMSGKLLISVIKLELIQLETFFPHAKLQTT